MKMRLHEIELYSNDTIASQKYYKDILGLEVHHEMEGLNVFDSGWPGIDFDTSKHNRAKVRIGFVVDDMVQFLAALKVKGIKFNGPKATHLGMSIIEMEDPDGNLIEIQEFSEKTPAFLKKAFQDQ